MSDDEIKKAAEWIKNADAIIIGAGAGLSASRLRRWKNTGRIGAVMFILIDIWMHPSQFIMNYLNW